ncbi:MAG: 3-hydroxybutyryl-CoA dehydrogenase [Acidobacteria bacterium 13_1_20CM_2_55_15]|nr:MAG: 3-hydroxybutyryl-CoA dehydrogenase [Acidobacteria bacterium 13_1_40CM_56_16]OLD21015.1 MAG: 3-hydroxybutyryl-CoA dehydrogenase [Acidobacteria bacterium 13_1_40CM_3_56_11]OLE89306.1 MAG: 3-hydroxybutyryl-CoA dehydrogenase [Acidobacteria bacterium 13_1_20CM_2_55_15]
MDIQTIAIIGAGTMGNGIAHTAARSGFKVILHDIAESFLDRAVSTIAKNLEREVAKGRITANDKNAVLSRISAVTQNSALSEADFVIEAVIEDIETKLRVFEGMDRIARPDVILASNTSSISITKIASKTKRPDKVIGMHFMNPVPVMPLVEVVRGIATSDETYQMTKELAESLGKTAVEVNDFPGFVSNRVLMPMINEAVYCVMEGVGTAEAIDSVMKLGMNHPMGPLALADLIGLDVCLDIMEVLHSGLGDSKYRPCPLLRKIVDAGHLGRKSGRGFYKY